MVNLIHYILGLVLLHRFVSSILIQVTVEGESIAVSCHVGDKEIRSIVEIVVQKLNKTENKWTAFGSITEKYNYTDPTASEVTVTFPIAEIQDSEIAKYTCRMLYIATDERNRISSKEIDVFFTGYDAVAKAVHYLASQGFLADGLILINTNITKQVPLSVEEKDAGLPVGIFFGGLLAGMGAGACSVAAVVFVRKRLKRKLSTSSTAASTQNSVTGSPTDADGTNLGLNEVVPHYESLSNTVADSQSLEVQEALGLNEVVQHYEALSKIVTDKQLLKVLEGMWLNEG